MPRDRSSFCLSLLREAFYPYVMWGDSESAFKNTSIEINVKFREPFQKNLEIRMKSDLARSFNKQA